MKPYKHTLKYRKDLKNDGGINQKDELIGDMFKNNLDVKK